MPYRLLLAMLGLSLALGACTSMTPDASSVEGPIMAAPAQRAEAEAELANLPPAERTAVTLAWARSYLELDRAEDAEALLAGLDSNRLSADHGLEWLTLRARLALAAGNTADALTLLEQGDSRQWSQRAAPRQRQQFELLRADALALDGEFRSSLELRMKLDPQLKDEPQAYNRELIWVSLNQMPPPALASLAADSGASPALRGWAELAQIYRGVGSLGNQVAALEDWHARHPQHPAHLQPPADIAALQHSLRERPQQVAVLLPERGSLAGAGQAVRDGLIAAYYAALADNQPVPELMFFDSYEQDAVALYQQAVSQGAQVVIGPLDKDQVTALAQADELPVPVLALNYAEDGASTTQLFQFGLAPEDEARQVARQAFADGARRAGLLYPDNDLGQRLTAAFVQEWQQLGGTIATQGVYGDDASQAARQFLDARGGRAHRLDRMDMVFLVANAAQGRQLKPALNFHFATDLPVYATSLIFTGQVDARRDADLNNILFVDAPWILAATQQPLHQTVARTWPQGHGRFERLFALGVDAYSLQERLALLRANPDSPLPGVTGRLTLEGQRLVRELDWAVFTRGRPAAHVPLPTLSTDGF
ncbi:penicillin-binding protein activator [Isoalcanivorax beigongshangi]|uniref:Penicillin-binding protein activator n=1 Tax=Isoalcanivorax beigongshangi TaxID=3238810 RepID=A0ABV4AIT6_9GAMM